MFNIQVLKNDLQTALNAISSTVGDNSQNLGDDCISITDTGHSSIEIYTTNSIEFSKATIILASGSSNKIETMPYVNFKRFKQMIESVPDGEYINIKANVNDIEITYGTRKKPLKLTGSVNGIIPLPTVSGGSTITIGKIMMKEALDQACTIIKDDVTNALTNCIRINTNGYDVEITAVDIKYNRMFLYKKQGYSNNTGSILVEANKLKKAFKLFNDFNDIEFECNNNVIKISGSDPISNNVTIMEAEYYLRVLSGNYPTNVANMFNNVNEFAVVNKDELKASLIRIDAIEDNTIGSGTMDFSINKNLVNITKTSQYGVVEDSFNTENEISNPIKETFKAKPFAEVLKNFADNAVYGTPNTFEIGQASINGQGQYYVLKETGSQGSMFLITGFGNNSTP